MDRIAGAVPISADIYALRTQYMLQGALSLCQQWAEFD
jgi:hypothetical protein